jgi:hypothetical protein
MEGITVVALCGEGGYGSGEAARNREEGNAHSGLGDYLLEF